MKKYLIIGNPVDHSLSPKIHNYWFKKYNINALYEKLAPSEGEIPNIIKDIAQDKIYGANITVPYKQKIIPYLDELTPLAKKANSVNTVYKRENKIIGDNTDILGFELALKHIGHQIKGKKVFILGAGGVVPSIVIALQKMGVSDILLSNRTKEKAVKIKDFFNNIEVIDWGKTVNCDVLINGTSLGLNNKDKFNLDFKEIKTHTLYYDVIYNPTRTTFLKNAKKKGNQIENGMMMFIYQAQQAFKIWHNILPEVDTEIIEILR